MAFYYQKYIMLFPSGSIYDGVGVDEFEEIEKYIFSKKKRNGYCIINIYFRDTGIVSILS